MEIHEISPDQFELVWPVFRAVIQNGDTYSYEPGMTLEEARNLWTTPPARTFGACEGNEVVGCYMLKPNQPGLGSHVANCGYMVAPAARGRGIGGTLCEHSLEMARASGFVAMQFNAVVASNVAAVNLWQKHGFVVVGKIPKAFRHAQQGLTDVLVMHRFLS
ncbi:MAG: N-acetyltransferase [Candidatus Dormibacteraceae bacterium]